MDGRAGRRRAPGTRFAVVRGRRVSGNFVPAELEPGLRFADSLGRAPVPVHFLLTVVKLSHVGVVRQRSNSSSLSDPKEKSARSKRIDSGMVLDFNEAGNLIGIELLTPWRVTLEAINNVLAEHGLELLKESDLKPLLAA